jgi:eukaryotic-like serine/threonine-protein kinase
MTLPRIEGDEPTAALPSLGWSVSEDISAAAPARPLVPGDEVGERYEIIRLLGQGGMGAVYQARDRELDREVALKVIRADMAANPQILSRFKQELILARKITHANVIRIFDLGEASGLKFITMEFIDGEDLQSLLKREGKAKPAEAARIMIQVCRALEAAQSEGVIHRDLKPQNIMLGKGGRACVMDFGIARSVIGEGLTETGAVIGTPDYMSPEQAKGLPADARSDLFSFGIIFYELLSGKNPFDADTTMGKLWKRTTEPACPPSDLDKEIPQSLNDIVKKCLEIDPQKRYYSATELLQQLEHWQGPKRQVPARQRTLSWKWITLGVVVVLAAGVVIALRSRFLPKPVAQHTPVTMLIADFDNKTDDPIFDGTLEPMLGISLEGASFISSYDRGLAKKVASKLQPSSTRMDVSLARLVAQREGIGLVVGGTILPQGEGYQVYVTTLDAATGNPIVKEEQVRASSKQDVLSATGRLAERIRKGLGDATPRSAQQSAAETFTAASLEAAHAYADAQSLQQAGKFVEAIAAYQRAIELDPNMGRAYAGIASTDQNLGKNRDAETNYRQAMARIDRMTDREKYRTRGGYYLLMKNDSKALEEFTALVKDYPADTAGYANLALAYFIQRNMDKALEEERRALAITPHSVLQHSNLSQYALYGGDFDTATREAQQILIENPGFETAERTLAVAKLATGHVEEARQEYAKLQVMSSRGASMAATGKADLALYEGQVQDAVDILEKAVNAELAAKDADGAANDQSTLALTLIALKKTPQARMTASQAAAASQDSGVLYRVAQVFLATGDQPRALEVVAPLGNKLESEPQLYAKLIAGEAQLQKGNAREALMTFREAQKLSDSWLGHFDLGRAYLAAGEFPEASTEFDTCLRRRGEATAVFFDDNPSYHFLPDVYYYQGRAREGLNSQAGAADSYKAFLEFKAENSQDPLVADAKKRLAKSK